MGLEELVSVNLIKIAGIQQLASFDFPALLAKSTDTPAASFGASNRAKRYPLTPAGQTQALTDWGISDTYSAFLLAMQQPVKPAAMYIIKRDAPVAQVKDIVFSKALATGDEVTAVVNNQTVSVEYATSNEATLTALAAAIQALIGVDTAVSDDIDTITVTAVSEWQLDISIDITGADPPTAEIDIDTPGRTGAADIQAAIAETETNLWYTVSPVESGLGLIMALAAAVQTTEKYLFVQSNSADIGTSNNSTNAASWLQALGYDRTFGVYRHVLTDYCHVAAAVELLTNDPGSSQVGNREYAGVVGSVEGQISTDAAIIAQGRNFNTYRRFTANDSVLREGVRVDGQPAESRRDLDYIRSDCRQRVFSYLKNTKKPPFSEDGLVAFRAVLQQTLSLAIEKGIARPDLPSEIVLRIMASQLTPRKYTGAKIRFYYQSGAISAEIDVEVFM